MNDYINIALDEAKKAFYDNEVPVGAVIVCDGKIISKQHNMNVENNIFHHAEILAIKEASDKIGDWRLNNCEMYVTLEPCPMCAGAIMLSRIRKIYIGTKSNILSNGDVLKKILQNNQYYHQVKIEYLNNKECSSLLTDFFASKR